MKKVFWSSVAAGLESYRNAVFNALQRLTDIKCIRMEDFGASSNPPLEACLKRLRECEIYVGIFGHRYGNIPPGESRSYTECEYDAAVGANKIVLSFLAPEEALVAAPLIEPDEIRERQKRLRERVGAKYTRETFGNEEKLATKVIQAVYNAIQNERERMVAHNSSLVPDPNPAAELTTVLLFPFVTNQAGFDTGVAISNTTADPFASNRRDGTCTINYYGGMTGGGPAPRKQVSGVIYAGGQLLFVVSTGGTLGIAGTLGFQGYLIVECRFPNAHGYAFISDGPGGSASVASSYLATPINAKRED